MRASLYLIFVALTWMATSCGSSDDGTGTQSSGNARARRDEDAGSGHDSGVEQDAGEMSEVSRVLDLEDVTRHPDQYTWFDFRPNVQKLILAGAAETEHIAILWYTTQDGGVGLHYHAKTESVYVIDGTQTDGKGDYPSGTVYFNPPGSGHQVTHSTGFFLLAYAAPPDFNNVAAIEPYTPVRIDTSAPDLTNGDDFRAVKSGVRVLTPELDAMGGMSAELIELSDKGSYSYRGNYLLVLRGECAIDGEHRSAKRLIVGTTITPQTHTITAGADTCLLLGVSF